MMKSKMFGFTLIEMLIVIVIIGILAAALIPRLQAVQGRARDSERKIDLRTIFTANEIYRDNYGYYPRPSPGTWNNNGTLFPSNNSGQWNERSSAIVPAYLTSIPVDPLNDITYYYRYGNVWKTGVHQYDLFVTSLENHNDPDACTKKGGYNRTNPIVKDCSYGAYSYFVSPIN